MTESNGVHPLYGVAIHHCIAEGDLKKKKQLSAEAEKHVAEVASALDKLKAEIKKAEGG